MNKQNLSILLITNFIFFILFSAIPHFHTSDESRDSEVGVHYSDSHQEEICTVCELERTIQKDFKLSSFDFVSVFLGTTFEITYTVNTIDNSEITTCCNDPPSMVI